MENLLNTAESSENQEHWQHIYAAGYLDGENDNYEKGYEKGYRDGYEEKEEEIGQEFEEDIRDSYDEGLETGILLGEELLVQKLGYDCMLNIQEKTQYQICYGDEVDLDGLIEAIKKLSDL